jgi:hypothetical protein
LNPNPPRRWPLALAALAGLAVACYTYRPWIALPFDIWDFREFVPILRRNSQAIAQLHDLLTYYASHGRQNALFYGSFVAQWHLFGEHSFGWQLLRFAVMATNVVLSWHLFRRLGMSWFGAAAGAALQLGGTPAVRGWVQLMAEPQGLLALLLAALLALRFQSLTHWKVAAAGIAALIGMAVFSKEVLAVLGVPVVLLAWCRRPDGTLTLPRWSPRNALLGALSLAVALGAAILLLYIRQQPSAVGYGMAYGQGHLSLAHFGANLAAELLPLRTGADARLGLLYPANLLFVILVVLGWLERLKPSGGGSRRQALLELGWIAVIPAAGALVYLPWPKFDSFYGLPFFLGAALLLGCAVSTLEARGRAHRLVVRAAAGLIVGYLALASRHSVAVATASLQLNVSLARYLKTLQGYDSVVIAGPRLGPRALPVQGAELREYAIAMRYGDEQTLPQVRDVDCEGGQRLLREGLRRVVLLTYSYGCGRFAQPSVRLRADFNFRDWVTLSKVEDSLTVDLLVPK